MNESENITKRAKSNLAFALMDLPEERRARMAQLYAFCRIIDDIVDEDGMTQEERHAALDRWVQILHQEITPAEGLESEVRQLTEQLSLDIDPMLKLIDGCRGDIEQKQPQTREDLLAYSYLVASCVGISSIEVMGASQEARDYAVALGYALQMVNILRDVSEDCQKYNRFYLPLDDMNLFGVTHEDIREKRHSYRLRELLNYEAALAEKFFGEASELYEKLNTEDKSALIPAQAMGLIYKKILTKMKADEFRIFEKRYRVNSIGKLWFLLRARIGNTEFPSLPSLSEWGFFKKNNS